MLTTLKRIKYKIYAHLHDGVPHRQQVREFLDSKKTKFLGVQTRQVAIAWANGNDIRTIAEALNVTGTRVWLLLLKIGRRAKNV